MFLGLTGLGRSVSNVNYCVRFYHSLTPTVDHPGLYKDKKEIAGVYTVTLSKCKSKFFIHTHLHICTRKRENVSSHTSTLSLGNYRGHETVCVSLHIRNPGQEFFESQRDTLVWEFLSLTLFSTIYWIIMICRS